MESKTKNTALLVLDLQMGTLARLAEKEKLIANVAAAIARARSQEIPVIYVVLGFRNGLPEISSNNKGFNASRQVLSQANMDEFVEIHPDIAPLPGDITVIKRRISAFTGSDLEVILRAKRIEHLILTGISTSGVVLSTLREATDKDYQLTVLSDCCADRDEEVHRIMTTKIFPGQAEVLTVAAWDLLLRDELDIK
ncbi:isochorismatase family cysteine hydrolase [Dyadobacter subterraneus]|uniref:Cysteine hydrolase n=1 Tax=Dyadobacter subterraneus TaxID=2773304 RepID=A0ABR9WGU2_9BACT|nr:isochorismatase family cysteine hydrolase [Dyadobacter subterraneus]MBE9463566.1 cysteine hydrolase [Dyadobacter subterraneus]